MNQVFVYRNLRFKDQVIWSCKSVKTGRVIAREPVVYLKDCTFRVSECGRERVRREQKKYVHAGVQGTPCDSLFETEYCNVVKVIYNPYKYERFVRADTGETVEVSRRVMINNEGVWAVL